MKKTILIASALIILLTGLYSFRLPKQQEHEPWTKAQLMEPATLAAIINNTSVTQPVIYSIGFGGGIKNSLVQGPVSDSANLTNWKSKLDKLPRETEIVIYCGCYPFEHCPNIRPAFSLLNEMGFKNHKLLDLPHNLRADWLSKGYPQQ